MLANESIIELGTIEFTLDEWTEFVMEAKAEGTSLGFDVMNTEDMVVVL